jgi:ABC-type lipoprotein export system ATPase subunit
MPADASLTLIQVINLTRCYQRGNEKILALANANLELGRGAFAVITGPSGGGKSTLLHLLGGIDRPTSGKLWVNGISLENASEADLTRFRRTFIGFVFQFYNLLPFISAEENAALPLLARGWNRKPALARAAEVLEEVGLADRRRHKPAELSGGEQQRVAIARAVIGEPALVLADEPTGDLDSPNAAATMALLRDLNSRLGITIIVATHNIGLIEPTDRVFTLTSGRLEAREC